MSNVFVTGGSGFVGQNLIPLLVSKGYRVKALARSKTAAAKLIELGAEVVTGDLLDAKASAVGVKDCQSVFHLAASVDFFADEKELYNLHVGAVKILVPACKIAGVKRLIYLGAASVIMNGRAINGATEDFKSDHIVDGYSRTKLEAETFVLQSADKDFSTISLRPPLIWGKGEANVLPQVTEAVKKGQMQFIGGGKHKFVTCHVRNVCEALIQAEQSWQSGKAYFINDAEPQVFKDFITKYLATQKVLVPDKSVPLPLAKVVADLMEFVWKAFKLKGHPPLYRGMVNALGLEFITSDAKARRELNYKPLMSISEGLKEMQT